MAKDNRYTNRYIELHQHQVKLKINEITEPELLKWVTSRKNIQGYIKDLIRKDMWENGLLDSLVKSITWDWISASPASAGA